MKDDPIGCWISSSSSANTIYFRRPCEVGCYFGLGAGWLQVRPRLRECVYCILSGSKANKAGGERERQKQGEGEIQGEREKVG